MIFQVLAVEGCQQGQAGDGKSALETVPCSAIPDSQDLSMWNKVLKNVVQYMDDGPETTLIVNIFPGFCYTWSISRPNMRAEQSVF